MGILKENYTILRRRLLSANSVDSYLEVVLFKHKTEDYYATALYNAQTRGFFGGHYDLLYAEALKDFQERE